MEEKNPNVTTVSICMGELRLEDVIGESKTITKGNKFKIGDKVKVKNNDGVFEVIDVLKFVKGGYRYDVRGKYSFSNVREGKLSAYESKAREPKFKVGDYVRVTDEYKLFCDSNGTIGRIKEVANHHWDTCAVYVIDNCRFHCHEFALEAYEPREGEFVHVEGNGWKGTYRFKLLESGRLHNDACYTSFSNGLNVPYLGDIETSIGSNKIIPATEEQKQTLIKAIEGKYNKTYCEETKEWVDVKLFNKLSNFTKELESLIDRYSLEEVFGNIPSYEVAADMVSFAQNPRKLSFEEGSFAFNHNPTESPERRKYSGVFYDEVCSMSMADFESMANFLGWERNPEYKPTNTERFRQITEANKETIELLVKVGVLQDPTSPSDVYSHNVGKSDYAKKSPIQPWHMWQLWHWLTPWDDDIIKRLYRDKEGTSRIEDYNKIIHICKERIRQLNE